MVETAHTKLPEVRAWAVRDIEPALQAIESGCDGFTINWPDWFVHQV
jgi:glycerophosphoryl diester phosphodiesterase